MTKETFTLEEIKVILKARKPKGIGCYCDGGCDCYGRYMGAESLFNDICYDFGFRSEDLKEKFIAKYRIAPRHVADFDRAGNVEFLTFKSAVKAATDMDSTNPIDGEWHVWESNKAGGWVCLTN